MKRDIYLTQTKEEAAGVIVDAHLRQYDLHNQVSLYILDGKIDFSNGSSSPYNADDLYQIWEWTLGETPEAIGLAGDDVREILVNSALDLHGLNMVPDALILPDGTEATIWYKGEY